MSYTYTFAPRTRTAPPVPIVRLPQRQPLPMIVVPKKPPPPPPPEGMSRAIYNIIRSAAEHHRVTVAQMMGDNRHVPVVLARQEAWWRIWREHGYSYPRIGRLFKKDHTTVLYGVRKHQERVEAGAEEIASQKALTP